MFCGVSRRHPVVRGAPFLLGSKRLPQELHQPLRECRGRGISGGASEGGPQQVHRFHPVPSGEPGGFSLGHLCIKIYM